MPDSTRDLSLVTLVLQADPVVKAVMLLLVLASIAVWTVVLDKAVRFGRIRGDMRRLDAIARQAAEASPAPGLAGGILEAGLRAAQDCDDQESRAERRDRLRETMRLALGDGLRPAEPGLPMLATVGSAAPFVGLFGTVWGIMTSFTGIAASNDTSLAVVAPGIAEALFSTAVGLAAAIPAVVAYNKLVTHLGRSRALGLAAISRLADRLSAQRPGAVRKAAE